MDAEAENSLAKGFRDVDAGAADKMERCLIYLDSLAGFKQYKNAILERMNPQPGSVVADLGCGLGFDVRRLAARVGLTGRAIGVDASLRLIESARSASEKIAHVEFVQADIRRLPFADGLLQSCKVDRTLQHVQGPALVIQEMFRTICPGGTAVCAEPDWGTFRIEVPWDAGDRVSQEVSRLWTEGFRNPGIGREVGRMLAQAGFVNLTVQEFSLSTSSFESSDMVFDLSESTLRLAKITAEDTPLAWLSQLREHGEEVRCTVSIAVHSAQRP